MRENRDAIFFSPGAGDRTRVKYSFCCNPVQDIFSKDNQISKTKQPPQRARSDHRINNQTLNKLKISIHSHFPQHLYPRTQETEAEGSRVQGHAAWGTQRDQVSNKTKSTTKSRVREKTKAETQTMQPIERQEPVG